MGGRGDVKGREGKGENGPHHLLTDSNSACVQTQ